MTKSPLEALTSLLIAEAMLREPIREYRLCKDRKWRCDFVWIDPRKVILEIEGGIWTRGRHVRPLGIINDIEKYNEAALLGFTVIRATKEHLENGKMIQWIKRALEGENVSE